MSRYADMFARCEAAGEGAFGTFLMLGDPDAATCARLLDALVEGGADMVELGIPFSDPVADGPVIQAAAVRAVLAVPLRRQIAANWLVPVAEIGTTNPQRIPLRDGVFEAGQDGPLSLWVNDLIVPCPAWDCFYRNNAGGPATVRISKAEAPALPPLRPRDTCGD